MQQVIDVFQFIVANGPQFIAAFVGVSAALVALFHAVIAVALIVPGEQPEKFLQGCLDKLQKFIDFVTKFSKK